MRVLALLAALGLHPVATLACETIEVSSATPQTSAGISRSASLAWFKSDAVRRRLHVSAARSETAGFRYDLPRV